MTDQTASDAAAAGMTAASRAIRALSQGEDDLAIAALNSTSHAEATWAAAYLMSGLQTAARQLAGGDERRARRLLEECADNLAEDVITTHARMIVHEAERET